MMKVKITWALAAAVLLAAGWSGSHLNPTHSIALAAEAVAPTQPAVATSPGRVTMIDLGAGKCIPCKMMAPIIEELKKEYAGRADIRFIDVWKNPEQAKKYGIRAIPTQIFFNAYGKEVHRHVGFMEKKRIIEVLSAAGAN
jgi:thioredoxin 1